MLHIRVVYFFNNYFTKHGDFAQHFFVNFLSVRSNIHQEVFVIFLMWLHSLRELLSVDDRIILQGELNAGRVVFHSPPLLGLLFCIYKIDKPVLTASSFNRVLRVNGTRLQVQAGPDCSPIYCRL